MTIWHPYSKTQMEHIEKVQKACRRWLWGHAQRQLDFCQWYTIANTSFFTFDLEVKVTQNVAQYPLHHVTYAPAKFEVATSNHLSKNVFTRKYSI